MKLRPLFHFLHRNRFIFLAIICYMISCAFMYHIQWTMFDQAIQTPFFYFLFVPPVLLASQLPRLLGKKERAIRPKTRVRKTLLSVISGVSITLCTLLIGFFTYKDPYFLNGYLYFALLLLYGVFSVWIKRPLSRIHPSKYDGKWAVSGTPSTPRKPPNSALGISAAYAILLAAGLLYLLILHPCSIQKATEMLIGQGYTGTVYCGHYPIEAFRYIYPEIPEEFAANTDNTLGYYLFRTEKAGVTHAVFIRITDGKTVKTETAPDNQVLRNLLEYTN